jgi:uncharacterized protein YfdQ (DUF2303 family)
MTRDRKFFKRIAGYIQEDHRQECTVEMIQEKIALCSENLNNHKVNSNANRHRWLDDLATAIAQSSAENLSKVQKAQKQASTIRMLIHIARTTSFASSPSANSSLSEYSSSLSLLLLL